MNEPPYTREILRLAASIPYLEPFEELEGATERRSPTCGSRMRMAVELDWADRVVRLRQAVEACAYGQASAALMGGHAMGRSADEVGAGAGRNWRPGWRARAMSRPRGRGLRCWRRRGRARGGMARSCCRSGRLLAAIEEARMSAEAQAVDDDQRAARKRRDHARHGAGLRHAVPQARAGRDPGLYRRRRADRAAPARPGRRSRSSWPAFPKSASRCCCSSSGSSFSPSRLWRLRKDIFGLGLAQVVLCGLALSLFIHFALGMTPAAALAIGLPLGLSSTAQVLPMLRVGQ